MVIHSSVWPPIRRHVMCINNSLIFYIYIIIRKYYHTYFELINAFYIWFWNNAEYIINFVLIWILIHEFVFCRRMKLNKWICAKDKANGLYFYKGHDGVKKRPTQLNLSPIGTRNQRKFTPNSNPIRIRIPACTSVSIWSITFGSDV